jgi:hypothetical protein
MKMKLAITSLLLALTQSLSAQTADDYVTQGRAFLSATNLAAANNTAAGFAQPAGGQQFLEPNRRSGCRTQHLRLDGEFAD